MKKLFSIMMCAMLVLGLPVMAFADTFNYTPINGPEAGADSGFSFEKDFEMPADVPVPAATFSYVVAPGSAVDAGTGTAKVLAGVGIPTIEDVVYTANEQASADMTITVNGDTKTATKIVDVDFSDCEFTEPGIYRYIVTESGDNQGVTNDPIATRTLDVYVVNEGENELKVDGFVFYEGTRTDAPSATATTAEGKSEGYTNVYTTYELEFGKEVKGNFGSLDQYFAFTVVLGGMEPGTVLPVDLTDADATPHESDANEVTTAANPTSLTVGADGTVTQVFYIHDGQYIVIKGLPVDATYSVTEEAHDYTSAEGIVEADNDEGVAHTDAVSGTIGAKTAPTDPDADPDAEPTPADDQNIKTGYTNTKDVVTPTGIANALTTFGPAVLVALVAIAGIVVFSRKKRTNE